MVISPEISAGSGNGIGVGIGVREGTRVSVGGIGEGVKEAVRGTGDEVSVIVGTGEVVGIMAGSAVQPVINTTSKINAIRCFMMSPY